MFVVTDLELRPEETSIVIVVHTDLIDVLWLRWDLIPFPFTWKYRTVRGVEIKCGFTYFIHPGNIIAQQEEGVTFTHTFQILGLECGTAYGFVLVDNIFIAPSNPQLGPLFFETLPCPLTPGVEIMADFSFTPPGSPPVILITGISATFSYEVS